MVIKIIFGLLLIGRGLCCKLYFPGPNETPVLVYKDKDVLRLTTLERNLPTDAISTRLTSTCLNNPSMEGNVLNENNRNCVFKNILKTPLNEAFHNCIYYIVQMQLTVQYHFRIMTLQRNEACETGANVCEYEVDMDWSKQASSFTNMSERYEQLVPASTTPVTTSTITSTAATIPPVTASVAPQASVLVEYACVPETGAHGVHDEHKVLIQNGVTPGYFIKMNIYLNKLGHMTIKCSNRNNRANLSLKLTTKRSEEIIVEDLYYVQNQSYNLTCGGATKIHWIIENENNKIKAIKKETKDYAALEITDMDKDYDKFKIYCVEFKCTFQSELFAECVEEIMKETALHLMRADNVSEDDQLDNNGYNKRLILIIVGVCLPVSAAAVVVCMNRSRRGRPRPRLATPPPARRPPAEPYYSVAREGPTRFGRWDLMRTAYESRKSPAANGNVQAPERCCGNCSKS